MPSLEQKQTQPNGNTTPDPQDTVYGIAAYNRLQRDIELIEGGATVSEGKLVLSAAQDERLRTTAPQEKVGSVPPQPSPAPESPPAKEEPSADQQASARAAGNPVRAITDAIIRLTVPGKSTDLIERGQAHLSPLPKPVNTGFGRFTQVYDYELGCIPTRELNSGVGALIYELSSKEDGAEDLIVQLGKDKRSESDEYALVIQNDQGVIASQGHIPGEILPEVIAKGAEFEGKLPDGRGGYKVTKVLGLTEHGRDFTPVSP